MDEDNATVTVAAGISQRILLDYLSNYKYWKQPSGWSLQVGSFLAACPVPPTGVAPARECATPVVAVQREAQPPGPLGYPLACLW